MNTLYSVFLRFSVSFIIVLGACKSPAVSPQEESPGKAATKPTAEETENPKGETAPATLAQGSARDARPPAGEASLPAGTDEQLQIMIQAKSAFLSDDWQQARVLFQRLIDTGPVSGPQVTAYIALGKILRDDDDLLGARRLYERLLGLAPQIPEVHYVVGRTLAEQGETQEAIKALERTLKMRPDFIQIHLELGQIYLQIGQEAEGQKSLYRYEQEVYALAKELGASKTSSSRKLQILDVFSYLSDDRVNQAVLTRLGDAQPEVREAAVALIDDFGLDAGLHRLEALSAGDPDTRVRFAAKAAIESLRSSPNRASAAPTVEVQKGDDDTP
jgi:tetratricopeptide (TPR) repeat protein